MRENSLEKYKEVKGMMNGTAFQEADIEQKEESGLLLCHYKVEICVPLL